MRLFFAIDFDAHVKDAIARAIAAFPVADPPWRWVSTANLHMTLKFLGDMPELQIPALVACAQTVASDTCAFSIRPAELGGFPSLSRPRVLFYKIDQGADALVALAERLDGELSRSLGLQREKRPFRAHATIARIKTRPPASVRSALRAAPPLEVGTQHVEKMVLVESRLHPQGAKYYHLKEFALTKPR